MPVLFQDYIKKKFNEFIREKKESDLSLDYIDILLEACEEFEIEVDNSGLKNMLDGDIKSKLKTEFSLKNLLPKEPSLSTFIE
jgi:hypothetical protein